jgi:hypothetical protein
MKKIALLLSIVCFYGYLATAQTAAKSVFIEAGGPGIASFNFDTRFSKRQNGLGMRAGMGGFVIDSEGVILVPVGINYLLGRDGRDYFEVGANFTPILLYGSNVNSESKLFSKSFSTLSFGYRMQPSKSGFTFRASINPIISRTTFWPLYGGVSVGYKF